MPIYEIVNPSDTYTIEHDREKVAIAAVLLLGSGAYALSDDSGNTVGPMLMFSNEEIVQKAMQDTFGMTLNEFIDKHKADIIQALDSVLIGGRQSRILFDEAISRMTRKAAAEYAETYHDKMRSSMNDIGSRAKELVEALRKESEK